MVIFFTYKHRISHISGRFFFIFYFLRKQFQDKKLKAYLKKYSKKAKKKVLHSEIIFQSRIPLVTPKKFLVKKGKSTKV